MEIKSFITYDVDVYVFHNREFIQQLITGEEVREVIEVYFDFAYQLVKRIPPYTYTLNLN